MQITRKSFMTGITRTVDLDVTQQQLDNYENGVLLQDAFEYGDGVKGYLSTEQLAKELLFHTKDYKLSWE